MPSFKPKPVKKIQPVSKNTVTLDNHHSEILETIENNDNVIIPQLLKEKRQYKKYLKKNISIEDRLNVEDKIKNIKEKISELNLYKKRYHLDNAGLVFEYFENKKKISEGMTQTKVLDSFFKKQGDNSNSNEEINNINTSVHKYLSNINEQQFDLNNYIVPSDICKFCNKGELIPVEHDGILVCNHCSCHVPYLVESEKPSYKEPPKEVCFYAYKRINHFREILAQFQAKETTQIPNEVIENIKSQIKKERISIEQINNKKAKEILKKLGYNKYYEHIPFIKDKLGIRPPIMSPELEETLCNLFMEIQGPYAKYCPDDRVNFLNYYYTVYKLCELLERDEFLPYFPMLKDREKRIEQDEIWKKICEELNWEFIPTI